jgi:hypothetical protein
MIAASSGIGFLVLNAQNLMETTALMVGIVLLSLLGLPSHWLLTRLGARGDPLEGGWVRAAPARWPRTSEAAVGARGATSG